MISGFPPAVYNPSDYFAVGILCLYLGLIYSRGITLDTTSNFYKACQRNGIARRVKRGPDMI